MEKIIIDMTHHKPFMNDSYQPLLEDSQDRGPEKYLEWILTDIFKNQQPIVPYSKQKVLTPFQRRYGEGMGAKWVSIGRTIPLSKLLSWYHSLSGEKFNTQDPEENERREAREGSLRASHMEAMHDIATQICLDMEFSMTGQVPRWAREIVT